MTLTRLPDPTPDQWLPFPQIMRAIRAKGQPHGPLFGNFWAARPCRIFPHDWKILQVTDQGTDWPRVISRCTRCGSQIHQGFQIVPPTRGVL